MSIRQSLLAANFWIVKLLPSRLRSRRVAYLGLILIAAGPAAAATVGAIPGSFAVDATGAATYSMALQLPPGINGMTPHLSLTYHSRGGNGLLGRGWGLSGLSTIVRCASTLIEDGQAEGVNLTADDRFCLDGNKLRATGSAAYGADGATYATEIESFRQITSHTSGGAGPAPSSGPQWFSVQTQNGLTYEYGATANAEVLAAGTSVVRTWLLDKITDPNGNTVTFHYAVSNGAWRPTEIDYTGNGSVSPAHQVLFSYDTLRPDVITRYLAGSLIQQTQRLASVAINYNGATVLHYDLAYQTAPVTNLSRLVSVTECAGSGTGDCLPATTVGWQNGTSGWDASVDTGVAAGADADYVHVMDVNGDGRDDLVWPIVGGDWMILFATSNGSFAGSATDTGIAVSGDYYAYARVINYNGDDKADLILGNASGYWRILESTGNGFTIIDTNTGDRGEDGGNYIVGNINGDGRDDIYWKYSWTGAIWDRLNTGSGFGASTHVDGYVLFQDPRIAISLPPQFADARTDYDGDGLIDRLTFEVYNTSTTTLYYWHAANTILGHESNILGTDLHFPIRLDLNGDGLTDLIWTEPSAPSGTDDTIYTMLSTGTGINGEAATGMSAAGYDQALVVDANGDGYDDLLIPQNGIYTLLQSNGATLVDAGSTGLAAPADAGSARVTDIDGNGLGDLVWAANGTWHYALHSGIEPDLVTQITDGLGNFHQIAYAPLTSTAAYTQGSAAVYPDADIQTPLRVVQSYTANDGIGGSYTESYHYTGARANLTGRGFEGFAAIGVTDSRNGVTVTTNYRQDFPYTGLASEIAVAQSSGTKISDTVNTYSDKTYGDATQYTDRYFPYASDSQTSTYDLDGSSIKTVDTASTFNDNGHPTDVSVTTTGGGATFTTDTAITYDSNASTWCYGLPSSVTVTATGHGATASRQTQYANDTTACRADSATQGAGEPLALTAAYTYDGYGHRQKVALSGSGLTGRSTTASYGSAEDFPATVTNALGQPIALGWDAGLGVKTRLTDANGHATQWAYDGFGRQQLEIRADGSTIAWTYQACGSAISCPAHGAYAIEMSLTGNGLSGGQQTAIYDRYGRVIQTQRLMPGNKTALVDIQYDALGRKNKQSAPYFSGDAVYWTTYTYDLLNRVIEVDAPVDQTTPSGNLTRYSYAGLVTTVTNPKSQITRTQYDALGEVVQKTDAYGTSVASTTSYTYTPFGELETVTDADNNVTTLTYNARGMKTAIDDPDMGHWSYVYDAAGELTSQTDAKGQTITQTYDALGRLTSRTEPQPGGGTGTDTWTYDSAPNGVGALAQVVGADGFEKDYGYDNLSRLANVTRVIDGSAYTISKTYDGLSRVASVMYPDVPVSLADANAPVADAGPDQTAYVNQAVTLEGSASDADGDTAFSFSWKEDAGSPVAALANPNTPTPSFTPTVAGSYGFTLTVSDGLKFSADHVTVTVAQNVPAPGSITASPTFSTNGSFTVSWGGVTGADCYQLQQSTSVSFPNGDPDPACTNYGVSQTYTSGGDGTYYYRVRSLAGGLPSAWRGPASVEVLRQPGTPAAPGVGPNPSSSGNYTVTWSKRNDGIDVNKYNLQESINGGSWHAISSTGTSWSPPSAKSNGGYRYRVQACNLDASGRSACSDTYSPASVTETVLHKPGAPSAYLSIDSTVDGESFTVSWSKPSGSIGHYNLEEYDSGSSGGANWAGISPQNVGLVTSKTYPAIGTIAYRYYRVQACNNSGCGGWSNTVMEHTVPAGCIPLAPATAATPSGDTVVQPDMPPCPGSATTAAANPRSTSTSSPLSPRERAGLRASTHDTASVAATARVAIAAPAHRSNNPVPRERVGVSATLHGVPASRFTYDARLARTTARAAIGPAPGLVYAPPLYQARQSWRLRPAAFTTYTADTTTTDHLTVQYTYDAASGNLVQIANATDSSQVYWQSNGTNAFGEWTGFTLGNGVGTTRTYDAATGRLDSIKSGVGTNPGSIQSLTYTYGPLGNLATRADTHRGLSERFNYDDVNRLVSSALTANGQTTTNLTVTYDEIGNIQSRSGVGTYAYASAHPHAVGSISGTVNASFSYDANGNLLSGDGQNLSWTAFNKPSQVNANDATSQFWYAPDHSRYKQITTSGGSTTTTVYVGNLLQIVTRDGLIQYKHLIQLRGETVAILDAKSNGAKVLLYLHHAALGSVNVITDTTQTVVAKMSFGAFGVRRNADAWSGAPDPVPNAQTTQGYTDHEELDAVGLVNMNGRLYDPAVGRYVSPDPIVQAPYFSQSYNRYSYVENNPTTLIDPTGFVAQATAGGGCGTDEYGIVECGGGGGGGGGGFDPGVPTTCTFSGGATCMPSAQPDWHDFIGFITGHNGGPLGGGAQEGVPSHGGGMGAGGEAPSSPVTGNATPSTPATPSGPDHNPPPATTAPAQQLPVPVPTPGAVTGSTIAIPATGSAAADSVLSTILSKALGIIGAAISLSGDTPQPLRLRHYTNDENPSHFADGLNADSYATTASGPPLTPQQAQSSLALKITPTVFYNVTIYPGVVPFDGPSPVFPKFGQPGGGIEFQFPDGTPPGSVTGPYPLPGGG